MINASTPDGFYWVELCLLKKVKFSQTFPELLILGDTGKWKILGAEGSGNMGAQREKDHQ